MDQWEEAAAGSLACSLGNIYVAGISLRVDWERDDNMGILPGLTSSGRGHWQRRATMRMMHQSLAALPQRFGDCLGSRIGKIEVTLSPCPRCSIGEFQSSSMRHDDEEGAKMATSLGKTASDGNSWRKGSPVRG
jgi:hypothetical protein